MPEESAGSVPEGAAVFPQIPAELGVDPLLLAAVHAVVFLDGSDQEVVHPAAAAEAIEYLAGYFQRLEGQRLQRAREDIACLVAYARQEKWPKAEIRFLQDLLATFGVDKKGGR